MQKSIEHLKRYNLFHGALVESPEGEYVRIQEVTDVIEDVCENCDYKDDLLKKGGKDGNVEYKD